MYRLIFSSGIVRSVALLAALVFTVAAQAQEPNKIYLRHCAACHGENGDGQGPAARYLSPQPRDFSRAVFKFRSTPSGSPPTDADIERTIRRGVPGTAMPGFDRMSDADVKSVTEYVKTFSDVFADKSIQEPPISIGNPPRATKASVKLGAELYKKLECVNCHGETGHGDGPSSKTLVDDFGVPLFAYDFTRGPMLMKGGATAKSIYRTFMTGLDGTGMPSYVDLLAPDERWPLVHFIQSLSKADDNKLSDAPVATPRLTVSKLKKDVSLDVDDKIWRKVPTTTVPLRPLIARDVWTYNIKVQIAKGPTQIAFRFEWQDAQADNQIEDTTDFLDGVALEYVPTGMPEDYLGMPFIGMGDQEEGVYIWQWKANAQADASDAQGNTNNVQALEAKGFGTLEKLPVVEQTIEGKARWHDGTWVVVLRQKIDSASHLNQHGSIPLAIAAWDGHEQDRAGQKSISNWMELKMD